MFFFFNLLRENYWLGLIYFSPHSVIFNHLTWNKVMLNQITISKTLLFSSGMASQGETWPFQEGLVRAHWQNVRPLQMSQ